MIRSKAIQLFIEALKLEREAYGTRNRAKKWVCILGIIKPNVVLLWQLLRVLMSTRYAKMPLK